jgi:hypothetical protein
VINYDVDDKQIQKDLQNLIEKGGLNKKYAKMAVRSASDVIDDQSRKNYANAAYKYGSSSTHLKGNMLTPVTSKIYIARPQWRKWAARKASLKFQSKKQQKGQFWYRSMVKRTANGRGNPSHLSHLIEDGARNVRTGKKNRAWSLRRIAFASKRREALKVMEKGIVLAFKNATSATKMGLVQFRKTTRS